MEFSTYNKVLGLHSILDVRISSPITTLVSDHILIGGVGGLFSHTTHTFDKWKYIKKHEQCVLSGLFLVTWFFLEFVSSITIITSMLPFGI